MANDAIEKRRLELQTCLRLPFQISPDLPQTKQVEVINDERGGQYQHPAEGEAAVQQHYSKVVLNIPYGPAEGHPFPEQKQQRGAAGQDIRAALHCNGHGPCEDSLEGRPGHYAVLQREKRQQSEVYEKRRLGRTAGCGIHRFRDGKIADESDCIQKSGHEEGVTAGSVEESENTLHAFATPLQ